MLAQVRTLTESILEVGHEETGWLGNGGRMDTQRIQYSLANFCL